MSRHWDGFPQWGIKHQQKNPFYTSLQHLTKPWCARRSAVFIIHIMSSTRRICKIFKSVRLLNWLLLCFQSCLVLLVRVSNEGWRFVWLRAWTTKRWVAVLSRGRVGSLLLLPLVGAAVMGRVGTRRRRALHCLLAATTLFIAVKALSSSTKSNKQVYNVIRIIWQCFSEWVISFDLIRVIVS